MLVASISLWCFLTVKVFSEQSTPFGSGELEVPRVSRCLAEECSKE